MSYRFTQIRDLFSGTHRPNRAQRDTETEHVQVIEQSMHRNRGSDRQSPDASSSRESPRLFLQLIQT